MLEGATHTAGREKLAKTLTQVQPGATNHCKLPAGYPGGIIAVNVTEQPTTFWLKPIPWDETQTCNVNEAKNMRIDRPWVLGENIILFY